MRLLNTLLNGLKHMNHKQPALHRIISQSLKNESLSHAYLLVGDAFLLESAYWLAGVVMNQSLDNEDIVQRIKEGLIVDFVLIDGSKDTVRKDDILSLQEKFKSTALEATNQKVVIIHQVHNANIHAMNSVLKFLEEPSGSTTTFILTSDTPQTVLPTITSRCMVINLEPAPQEEWVLNEPHHPVVEHHLKATCYSNQEAMELLNNPVYGKASEIAVDLVETLPKNVNLALVNWQLATQNERDVMKFVVEIMIEHCRALMYNVDKGTSFSLPQIKGLLETFVSMKSKLNPSTHIALLVDEGCYNIQEVFYGKRI